MKPLSAEAKIVSKVSVKALDALVNFALIGLWVFVICKTIPTIGTCILSSGKLQTCSSQSFADLLEFINAMFGLLRQNATTFLCVGFFVISVASLISIIQRQVNDG
ncbi:MAG: hypothetical protein HC852_11180 [Acaryochloridaceae cyanobacterium RU_4_10]|nr:hypothetical protein [Acaryochloridaceae cyanobacterium RU_4_10]